MFSLKNLAKNNFIQPMTALGVHSVQGMTIDFYITSLRRMRVSKNVNPPSHHLLLAQGTF